MIMSVDQFCCLFRVQKTKRNFKGHSMSSPNPQQIIILTVTIIIIITRNCSDNLKPTAIIGV